MVASAVGGLSTIASNSAGLSPSRAAPAVEHARVDARDRRACRRAASRAGRRRRPAPRPRVAGSLERQLVEHGELIGRRQRHHAARRHHAAGSGRERLAAPPATGGRARRVERRQGQGHVQAPWARRWPRGRRVAVIQDLEALEGQQLVGGLDRLGLGRDQRGEPAGRDAARREVDLGADAARRARRPCRRSRRRGRPASRRPCCGATTLPGRASSTRGSLAACS